MATPPTTVAEFKAQFNRDFKFGDGFDVVMDSDITKAQAAAMLMFNTSLFDTSEVKIAFLYAAAHFLVIALQAAGGLSPVIRSLGAENRAASLTGAAGVGGVNVTYDVSAIVTRFPILSPFARTDYGAQYLLMVGPRLVGNVGVVAGPIDPGIGVPVPFAGP